MANSRRHTTGTIIYVFCYTLKLGKCDIKDDSGKSKLVLWNDKIELVDSDKIYLIKGYAKEFNEELQITLGYKGSFEEIHFD